MRIEEDRFGAVPFWFWNGDQEEGEIDRQLELAKAGGWRGLTIHARSGNRTPYLSKRWFELFRFTCEEAKKRGLELWIYDEEGYPSGSCGGRLLEKGDQFREKLLMFKRCSGKEAKKAEGVIRYFALDNPERPIAKEAIDDEMEILVVRRVLNPYSMVDYLNAEAGQEFKRQTHDVYERELREYFGDPIKVIYTDDIAFLFHPAAVMAWTDTMEETFQSMFGYSISDHLSYLIENIPGSAQVRRDYRECCTVMLNTNFVRPMHEWAKRVGLTFSGHLCCDEGPFALISRVIGDPSAFYMEEDVPGLDDYLTQNMTCHFMTETRNTNIGGRIANQVKGFPVTTVCKQPSAIANQFKGGKCSSEVLTFCGWGLPVQTQMAQLFFEFVLGVNIIVHHDCSYNTAGGTKRDCPASYFFQQPYFAVNREIYRPVKRTLALLNRGVTEADVLVIYPICAAWELEDGSTALECGPGSDPETEYHCRYPAVKGAKTSFFYTELLSEINLELLRRHISFEYGYERIIREYGKVVDGKLVLGACSYSTIVIPGIEHFPKDVQDVLDKFSAEGGRIIHIETIAELPGDIKPSIDSEELCPEVAVSTRRADGKVEYYLVNYSEEKQKIVLNLEGYELFDPLDGVLVENGGVFPKEFMLPSLKSCHVVPQGTIEGVEKREIKDTIFAFGKRTVVKKLTAQDWRVRRENDNIYVIDRLKTEDGNWYHYDIMRSPFKAGDRVCHEVRSDVAVGSVKYLYEAENSKPPLVNGATCEECVGGHPATQVLSGVRVDGGLKEGANTIEFELKNGGPEFSYFAGDFGVKVEGSTAKIVEARELTFGDLTRQGLPFYWGAISYETTIDVEDPEQDLFVEFEAAEGVVEAIVNGERVGVLYGAPWVFRLKGHLVKGKNTIRLVLRNTAQNFFGPMRKLLLDIVARWRPEQEPGMKSEDYSTASFGIMDVPEIKGISE